MKKKKLLKGIKKDYIMVNFEATKEEKTKMQSNADKFTKGNLSAWLRFAGVKQKPSKEELE